MALPGVLPASWSSLCGAPRAAAAPRGKRKGKHHHAFRPRARVACAESNVDACRPRAVTVSVGNIAPNDTTMPIDGQPKEDGFDMATNMHDNVVEMLKQTGRPTNNTATQCNDVLCGGGGGGGGGGGFDVHDHPLYHAIMSAAEKTNGSTAAKCGETAVRRPSLERVSRAHDESYMRPPNPGEDACKAGSKCEGRLIARYTCTQSADAGFTCVVFRLPSGEKCGDGMSCVLCLRKYVATVFYTSKASGRTKNNTCDAAASPNTAGVIMQPYRNVIECDGEYRGDACLYPSTGSFEGISDPFFRHERHRYKYVLRDADGGPRIVHRPSVCYFRLSPLCALDSRRSSRRGV